MKDLTMKDMAKKGLHKTKKIKSTWFQLIKLKSDVYEQSSLFI